MILLSFRHIYNQELMLVARYICIGYNVQRCKNMLWIETFDAVQSTNTERQINTGLIKAAAYFHFFIVHFVIKVTFAG